ncbi:molybdopterin-dependent oxidoreductase [Phytoactinopolyspora halotolerans]|uniref:Molybdopterin-dependent oxidoreductase n=1 Tax=Phytoactinopolyspora halotolerans TaxID=1981512 RepID=A0A6L9SC76_9ACTN|nr:molybdopterin-dependent oxidoreductase [Phytoactinopolyspora halotolerans]NEE02975.1 molybdopterin-dependent oxidoreductase [Phytoactinopolyspora halotolerans]
MHPKIKQMLSPRQTNVALFIALLLAFATGTGAVATGSSHGRWVVIGHGVAAMAVILLIPWKGRVVRRGLGRARRSRWASLLLAMLAVMTVVAGLGSSTGLIRSIGGQHGLWVHIAAALALVPLLIWHAVARRSRPRKTDLSRRVALRAGLLSAAATALYLITDSTVRLAGLPGGERRFTGSHEIGSFDPPSMPSTIWLNDTAPEVDLDEWRLSVVDGHGAYELTLPEVAAHTTPLRATLDCTSGWYAHQDWTGVPVSSLIRDVGEARSLLVHSVTGYWIRFPVDEIDRLLLATAMGGVPLARRHGFPLRLVAPGRRGYWWVKWVDRVELQRSPAWWQPPFPLA